MTNLMFSCDVPPHDEENCSTNEAELNGAGEKEWRTVLNELEKMMGVRQIGHTVLRYIVDLQLVKHLVKTKGPYNQIPCETPGSLDSAPL